MNDRPVSRGDIAAWLIAAAALILVIKLKLLSSLLAGLLVFKLVDVLTQIQEIARREGLLVANVFHAGDGNLHPTILYDARIPGLTDRVVGAGAEILRCCVEAGGTLSGEHGVGLEKQAYLDWVFGPADRAAQLGAKHALDPDLRFNPGKPFSGPLVPNWRA